MQPHAGCVSHAPTAFAQMCRRHVKRHEFYKSQPSKPHQSNQTSYAPSPGPRGFAVFLRFAKQGGSFGVKSDQRGRTALLSCFLQGFFGCSPIELFFFEGIIGCSHIELIFWKVFLGVHLLSCFLEGFFGCSPIGYYRGLAEKTPQKIIEAGATRGIPRGPVRLCVDTVEPSRTNPSSHLDCCVSTKLLWGESGADHAPCPCRPCRPHWRWVGDLEKKWTSKIKDFFFKVLGC